MLSRETFVQGPPCVPWPVRGDAYTVTSDTIVARMAKDVSVYNFTNRKSPADALPKLAKDGRMALYGLVDFVQRQLVKPVTEWDAMASEIFIRNRRIDGKPLAFDKEMWQRVVREYNGYLPIRIEALPEGSTFWVNEPVIQVTSLDRGFGEVAAIIEAVLVGYVANATARLTLELHLLERIREVVRKHNPSYSPEQVDGLARWMIHDFGFRAAATPEEAEIHGRAHLLVFHGTDTFSAAFQAWANKAQHPTGTSILALAHRIVMGHALESEAYEAMAAATIGSMGSYVADCYDFHNAVRKFLVAIAKKGKGVVVARPDSGDYVENVVFIVEQALEHDLYKVDEEGKPIATTLRFIQGDSMNWEKIQRIFMNLERKGVNPTQWGIFGIGGWLRNTPNRDLLSSAFKLSAFGRELHPAVKLSDTLAKVSVPGPNIITRPIGKGVFNGPSVYFHGEVPNDYDGIIDRGEAPAYRTFYDGSKKSIEAFGEPCLETFDILQGRVLAEFDSFKNVPADRGTITNPVLSRRILKLQQDTMRRYGKTAADYQF